MLWNAGDDVKFPASVYLCDIACYGQTVAMDLHFVSSELYDNDRQIFETGSEISYYFAGVCEKG